MKYFVFICVILTSFNSFARDIGVTVYVDGNYRPFSYSDNGKPKGMYIDILKVAFSRMKGFKVKMLPIPWKRGKSMMERGEGFALTPAFFHGHDWPYLYPYSLPFYTETIVAVCSKEVLTTKREKWPGDFIGLNIGNVAGFDGWGGEEFWRLVNQKRIYYEEAKGSEQNILKLLAGRLDCIMMEEKAFDYELRKLQSEGKYDIRKHNVVRKAAVIGKDPVYIGYSKPARENGLFPFQFEFMQAFDSEIYKMTKSGEIIRIMESYK